VTAVAILFISAGVFFLTVGSLGVIRLPDFYSRTHALGKADTLGILLSLTGLAIHHGFQLNSLKLIIVAIFVALANPTASHALARSALRRGLTPWIRRKAS
jgi:multicomponent Na+:H+ antiporter subunit G